MAKKEPLDEAAARKTLGIDEGKWIIAVGDEELALLKAAIRLHADQVNDLSDKIGDIGTQP